MDDFSGEINTYGKYLRRLRKSLGLRFETFRSLLGVSKAYLSDVESGKSKPPSPDMQLKIVDILSVMGNITKKDADALLDLAARERNEVPADIYRMLVSDDSAVAAIRGSPKYKEFYTNFDNGGQT